MESPIPILPLPTPDAETEKLIRMKDEEVGGEWGAEHLLCHLSAQPLWNIAISLVLLASFHRDRKYFGDLCSFATARPMQGRNKAGGQWVLEGQERLEGRFHPGIRV